MDQTREHDELLLLDFLKGELADDERRQVLERLDQDEAFRKLKDDIAHTVEAVALLPEASPPDQLAGAALERVRQAQRTEHLIAREESRRRAVRPTFSLREAIVAGVAVAIMAVAFIPSMGKARQRAIAAQCASNIGEIGAAMRAYANANNDYLPTAEGTAQQWLKGDPSAVQSNSTVLYRLVRQGYASHVVFRCPAGGTGTFRATADMTDFPKPKFITYSYQHTLGPRPIRRSDPALVRAAESMAILADGTPLFADGRFHRERLANPISDNHAGAGQNVLYLDTHVSWVKHSNVGVGANNIFLIEGVSDYRGDEKPTDVTDTFLLPTFSAPVEELP
jgi:type II secretory pathway pseudopilin PulG